ncbi:MAG: hypothetical protein KatS3mg115_1811 [Candidatus Poribacteria bacterium]|nr:MAG: hypothetical protein KatS3mg115_1811 [Candidatus Poribacteria bacterium]
MERKSQLFWLLILTLLGIGKLDLFAQEEAQNLVRNASFEEGKVGWSVWVEGAAGVQWDVDPWEQVHGKQSLLIDIFGAGNGQRVELHQNPFNLQQGQRMTFALWLKADNVRQARMIVNHRQAPWTVYGSTDILIDVEWKEFWVAANINQNDDIVGIYLELRDTPKGQVWVDYVRFYEGEFEPSEFAEEELAVAPQGKLAVRWADLKR